MYHSTTWKQIMARSRKKSQRSSYVVIPLGPPRGRVGWESARREESRASRAKARAIDLVFRLRFTIAVEVESAEDEAAI